MNIRQYAKIHEPQPLLSETPEDAPKPKTFICKWLHSGVSDP